MKFCPSCGSLKPGFAISIEAGNDDNAKWTIEKVGNKVALKTATGYYLSRCTECWVEHAYAHLNNSNEPNSQWTPVQQPNGKWTFQADNGRYLYCNECDSPSSINYAIIH